MTLFERLEVGDLCLEMHPSENGDHVSSDRARAIVGRYWTKGDLVQMTTVLIGHIRRLKAENVAPREALADMADLYDTDEGTRSLPQYRRARALSDGASEGKR